MDRGTLGYVSASWTMCLGGRLSCAYECASTRATARALSR